MATTLQTYTHRNTFIFFFWSKNKWFDSRFASVLFFSLSLLLVKCSMVVLGLFDVSQAICDFLQLHEWFVVTHKYWFDLRSVFLCFFCMVNIKPKRFVVPSSAFLHHIRLCVLCAFHIFAFCFALIFESMILQTQCGKKLCFFPSIFLAISLFILLHSLSLSFSTFYQNEEKKIQRNGNHANAKKVLGS